MDFSKQITLCLKSYIEANRLIIKHNLWLAIIFPGVINLLLIVLIYYVSKETGEIVRDWLGPSFEWKWLNKIINFFVKYIVILLSFFIYAYIYKYLVLMIMSPIMAFLSEKVEKIITVKDYPFSIKQLLKDIIRGLKIAVANLFKELLLSLLLFMVAFIPVIGFIAPILLFLVSSYFFGYSMIDYTMERHKLSIKEGNRFIWKHKWIAITNGAIFYLLFIIPVIGWVIAPTYGVISATLATLEAKSKVNR